MSGEADIRIARVYDEAGDADGARILVDRVWPRGVSKDEAKLDDWIREIAPSSGLRKWFDHIPAKWPEFRRRYRVELDQHPEVVAALLDRCRKGRVTLLYGARDREHNQAVALREYLLGKLSSQQDGS